MSKKTKVRCDMCKKKVKDGRSWDVSVEMPPFEYMHCRKMKRDLCPACAEKLDESMAGDVRWEPRPVFHSTPRTVPNPFYPGTLYPRKSCVGFPERPPESPRYKSGMSLGGGHWYIWDNERVDVCLIGKYPTLRSCNDMVARLNN